MAISLKSLRTVKADDPPRILFYGRPGVGKTTLASEFPNAVFIQTEDGVPTGVELASFGLLSTFDQVMEAVGTLYSEDVPFQTVVLDSVTAMQRLIFAEACARGDEKGHAKSNIEEFGYGKGYVYAARIWQELIDGLYALRRDKGMSIIMLAHAKIERFDDPETQSYDRYEIDLHDKSRGLIEQDMDAIMLLKAPVNIEKEDAGFKKERIRATGGNQVFLHTSGRPAFTAKNRYGIPDKFLYVRGKGYAELAKYLPAPKELAVADAAE